MNGAGPQPRRPRSRASAAAWSLVGLYVVLVLIGFRLQSQFGDIALADAWIFFAMLWFVVIGALIVGRHARHPIGWMFVVTGLSFAAALLTQAYAIVALDVAPGTLPGGEAMAWLGFWINMPGTAVIALYLPLLFPDGRLPSARWRPVAWAGAALAIVAVLATMLSPEVYASHPAVRNPLGVMELAGALSVLDVVTDVVFFLLIVLTAVALFERVRRADAEERLQIRWFVFAGAIVIAGFLVDLLPGTSPEIEAATIILSIVAVTLLPIAVGIAILRYRLYDIDVIINRTLVYGLLTAILAGLYAATLSVSERIFVAVTGQESDLALVLTLFVLTTVFTPIKTGLQSVVDGRLKPVARGAAPTPSELDDIVRLAELHRSGILTDEEFSAKKRQILRI